MRLLPVIFFIIHFSSSAQTNSPTSKTNFNKFIEKPSIEWAMYHNDTLQTDSPDLRDILITKMKEKRIKIFAAEIAGNINENNISNKKTSYDLAKLDDIQTISIFDSMGNEVATNNTIIKDQGPVGLLNVYQILYVENGKILSYTNRVSPLKNIITPSGVFLGIAEYFSTALNKNQHTQKSKRDKIIFLKSNIITLVIDSINKNDRLKETFGHNVIETLWPYIISNKISVFNVASNHPTTINQINNRNQLNLATVSVPFYDSLGNLFGHKLIADEIDAGSFNKISITQQWYYNDTKNIIYCHIPEAYLFLKRPAEGSATKDIKPVLKIIF